MPPNLSHPSRRPLHLRGGGGLSLAVPAAAQAAVSGTLVIRGGGDAHGIGMSQYGADGYALRGATFAVTS
jgi:hypothetical protein